MVQDILARLFSIIVYHQLKSSIQHCVCTQHIRGAVYKASTLECLTQSPVGPHSALFWLWRISINAKKPLTVCQQSVRSKPDRNFVCLNKSTIWGKQKIVTRFSQHRFCTRDLPETRKNHHAYKQAAVRLHIFTPTVTHQCFLCGFSGINLCLHVKSSCSFRILPSNFISVHNKHG